MSRKAFLLAAIVLVCSCVPPASRSPAPVQAVSAGGGEPLGRVARFRRLAELQGIDPPEVTRLTLPPGSVDGATGPVAVVRVAFPERTFFAFDSAVPLPDSARILDVIADDVRRDLPGAAITVLGHTDAVGTDAYNIDLSRRRAAAVLQALVARGVRPDQLSEVAIGKRQPIASNDTDGGRALNRRVEFLVSRTRAANLAAVGQRVVPAAWLTMPGARRVATPPATVAGVYGLQASGRGGEPAGLTSLGGLPLATPSSREAAPADGAQDAAVAPVAAAPVRPAAPVHLLAPADVTPRQLGEPVPY